MDKIFIDTNYYLRYLIKDIDSQQKKVEKLFQSAIQGKVALFTNTLVIFEAYWVFTSFYEKNKSEAINILNNMLSFTFIKLSERRILQQAINMFEQNNIDLEDCYNIIFAKEKKMTKFGTFDKKVKKFITK